MSESRLAVVVALTLTVACAGAPADAPPAGSAGSSASRLSPAPVVPDYTAHDPRVIDYSARMPGEAELCGPGQGPSIRISRLEPFESTFTVDDAAVHLGRTLYAGNGCTLCHGPDGQGNGPVARTLQPPPRDLSKTGRLESGRSVESLAETIRTGLGRASSMPPYDHLSGTERRALAAFVLSLSGAGS